MPIDSLEEVRNLLASGNFDALRGAVENEWLECKGAPYQLTTNEPEKQELAKDVSGLANASGGIILIGVVTAINPTHRGEEITEIRPFTNSLVNIDQYYDVLRSWIYPTLQQIDIRWYPSSRDQEKGIVAIRVPKQSDTKRSFIVRRTVEDTGKVNTTVFGYFERRRTNVNPMSVEELHALIRDGLHNDNLSNQYENIQEILSQILGRQMERPRTDLIELRNERVAGALVAVVLQSKPSFILTAIPFNEIEIQGLFESRDSDVVRLLEHPPELRSGGFDIDTGSPARIVRGMLRRAVSEGHVSLELWRDGTLIFIATGGEDFLSWGRYSASMDFLKINQLALIESTYLFAELSNRIFFEYSSPTPSEIEFTLELKYMTINDEPCGLYPGPVRETYFRNELHRAPDSGVSIQSRYMGNGLRPGQLAFELVKEVYRWFEFEDNLIPYTEQIEDHLEISPDQINSIRSY
jgi:hypothetical protein